MHLETVHLDQHPGAIRAAPGEVAACPGPATIVVELPLQRGRSKASVDEDHARPGLERRLCAAVGQGERSAGGAGTASPCDLLGHLLQVRLRHATQMQRGVDDGDTMVEARSEEHTSEL